MPFFHLPSQSAGDAKTEFLFVRGLAVHGTAGDGLDALQVALVVVQQAALERPHALHCFRHRSLSLLLRDFPYFITGNDVLEQNGKRGDG